MLDETVVDKARAVPIEAVIAWRNIKLSPGKIERCGPCPMCGGTDRFAINVKKQLFNCRGCEAKGDVIDLVRHLDGLSFGKAVSMLAGHAPPRKPPPGRYTDNPADTSSLALRIWRESGDPRGTPVETYLRSRRLELPDEAANEAIRFHADCLFGSERFPAMVCLARNIVTNFPHAIQRTALSHEWTEIKRDGKTYRLTLGPVRNCAVKIDADVTAGLAIGEGLETCLAARDLGFRPCWALGSGGAIAAFPVLPGIDALTILAEIDATGANARAVKTCGTRWRGAGREVIVVWPKSGSDINDAIREVAR